MSFAQHCPCQSPHTFQRLTPGQPDVGCVSHHAGRKLAIRKSIEHVAADAPCHGIAVAAAVAALQGIEIKSNACALRNGSAYRFLGDRQHVAPGGNAASSVCTQLK